MSDFKTRIYDTVARIPKGRVATYGQIAEIAGCPGAARAVGNAIHGNDDPIKVPCHRVVDASGRPGANYGIGGPAVQRERLETEGIVFSENGSVNLSRYGIVIEKHPLEPFLPSNGKLLFLGSFPPPKARWSMEFFYPNFINDFWRIMGLLFFDDKRHFEMQGEKRFDVGAIKAFCSEKGFGFYDTACKVCRWKGNASDEFLEIIEPADIAALLAAMPGCSSIVTTGGKSSEELLSTLASAGVATAVPPVGGCVSFHAFGRDMRWYRMPSSSRAYPMSLERKAENYRQLFIS